LTEPAILRLEGVVLFGGWGITSEPAGSGEAMTESAPA